MWENRISNKPAKVENMKHSYYQICAKAGKEEEIATTNHPQIAFTIARGIRATGEIKAEIVLYHISYETSSIDPDNKEPTNIERKHMATFTR